MYVIMGEILHLHISTVKKLYNSLYNENLHCYGCINVEL